MADPWDWDVGEVQNFFLNEAPSYIEDVPGKLPALEPFLAALGRNEIEGYTLLQDLTSETLRNDCGIGALGQRSMVMRCIVKLRRESPKYRAEHDIGPSPTSISVSGAHPAQVDLPATIPGKENEIQVKDAQGRKRRKLELTGPTVETPVQANKTFTESIEVISSAITKTPARSNKPLVTGGYLPDTAMSIEEMFFGTTPFDHPIQHSTSDGSQSPRNDSDENFQFGFQQKSVGGIRFVSHQMRHFLRNPESRSLEKHGRPAMAVLPYRASDAKAVRSAMVVQFDELGDEPTALRVEAAELDVDGDDELLPVFGADMDDEDYGADESSTPGTDIPEAIEEAEDEGLTYDKRAEIIDNFVADHVAKWQEQLQQLEEKRARPVWGQMKKSRILRDALIAGAQAKTDHLSTKLNLMKADLAKESWTSESDLHTQCSVLEGTIENREEKLWMISVWQRRQEPPRITRPAKSRSKVPPTTTANTRKPQSPTFVPHPSDRLSFSPAPVGSPVNGIETGDEIIYEADDEEYHTPDEDSVATPDVDDGFVVPDEVERLDSDNEQPSPSRVVRRKLPVSTSVAHALPSTAGEMAQSETDQHAESDDELPSPSKLLKFKMPPPALGARASSSTPKTPNRKANSFPTLGNSSSDSPLPKKRGRPSKSQTPKTPKTPKPLTGDAMDASLSEIEAWDWDQIAQAGDRQRISLFLVRQAGPEICKALDDLLRKLTPATFKNELVTACRSLRTSSQTTNLTGDDLATMGHARDLYLRWMFPTQSRDEVLALDDKSFGALFTEVQAGFFTSMLRKTFVKRSLVSPIKPSPVKARIGSSSAPVLISSSDERASELPSTQHPTSLKKKRKRYVPVDAAAQHSRKLAADRERRYNESQTTDPSRLLNMVGSDSGRIEIDINPARDADTEPVLIVDSIARRIKPHQIDGVRFLWRELTASGDEGGQGCILAHTMGLGKTMQAITLMVTLNESARSDDVRITSQLPKHLRPKGIRDRYLRVLVICPPSLLQNWRREINEWSDNRLGNIFTIESATHGSSNIDSVDDWMQNGGVILIGYHIFSSFVVGGTFKSKGDLPDVARVRESLIEGPEAVVADEVHLVKNRETSFAKATASLRTECRVGLTGTPMSNNVKEIFSLMDFVAPGYLGNSVEFNAHYAEPIALGLWEESSAYERRQSIKKLKVLHAEIQPKVNRATIEVLRGQLKPKIEYVITVALGDSQTELYKRTVSALLSAKKNETASQVRIFGWLAVLTLLTNHPNTFRQKLLEPPKPPKKKGKKGDDTDVEGENEDTTPPESGAGTPSVAALPNDTDGGAVLEADPLEQAPGALGFTDQIIKEILDGFDFDMDPSVSAKASIFLELLEHCVACGDKVLVFSSSLLTLDYLGRVLTQNKYGYRRIDSSITMRNRMRYLEEFQDSLFNVMLISTKAGGLGLNIRDANRVFIIDFRFNPTDEDQAIGRAYRLGQTKPVFVYRFVAGGTFETNIYNKQLFKGALAQRVVDQKNPRRNAKRNTRDYLYPPEHVAQESLSQEVGKDPNVLDKLLSRHGPGQPGKVDTMIRAIKTMETLHEDAEDDPLDEQELREVNEEIELGKKRPRGRKAAYMVAPTNVYGPPATQPMRPPPPPGFRPPPPPSTFAGPSSAAATSTFMGGLPILQQPRPS